MCMQALILPRFVYFFMMPKETTMTEPSARAVLRASVGSRKSDVPSALGRDTCGGGDPGGCGWAQPCLQHGPGQGPASSPQHQWGEEQDSPGEPLWGRAPLFPSLMDREEGKPSRASPSLHPAGRAGPANYSFSSCKCLLQFIELGRFLWFLFWAKLPLYLFTISRAACSHWS